LLGIVSSLATLVNLFAAGKDPTMKGVAVALLLATAGAMELTKDNWDDAVAGKTVFVKFQAPW